MLIYLPTMDVVTVPGLPSSLSIPSIPTFSGLVHILSSPSLWLVVLATLVILSSIRAAFLFLSVRHPVWSKGATVSLLVKSETSTSTVTLASQTLDKSQIQIQEKQPSINMTASTTTMATTTATTTVAAVKKMSSWCWGLVKWDTLPAFFNDRRNPGGWQPPPTMHLRRPQMMPHARGRPNLEHPVPAVYETQVPVSMAKMIMSRHTFRRPTSRPPPVRSTSTPQYQRRAPSMV